MRAATKLKHAILWQGVMTRSCRRPEKGAPLRKPRVMTWRRLVLPKACGEGARLWEEEEEGGEQDGRETSS